MLRILDVPAAFEGRGFPDIDAEATFAVDDPRYAENGRFFVNYTRRPDGATVIAEYRVSSAEPDVAARDEVPLLIVA